MTLCSIGVYSPIPRGGGGGWGTSLVGRGSNRARSSDIKSTLSQINHRKPTGQTTVKTRLTLVLDRQGFGSGGASVTPASPSLRILLSTPTGPPLSHALVPSLLPIVQSHIECRYSTGQAECDPAVAAGQQSKGTADIVVCTHLQLDCVYS